VKAGDLLEIGEFGNTGNSSVAGDTVKISTNEEFGKSKFARWRIWEGTFGGE
jgi:hypothetical protein